jgi:putative flippase GtrA
MMQDPVRQLYSKARATGLVDATLLRFAAIGLVTTALDLVLFSLLAVGAGVPAVAANIVSYSCGIVTSFVLNRSWTFGVARDTPGAGRHAVRFAASNIAGLLLSSTLVGLLVLVLPDVAAKVISVPLVFVWNYALARFWVFR